MRLLVLTSGYAELALFSSAAKLLHLTPRQGERRKAAMREDFVIFNVWLLEDLFTPGSSRGVLRDFFFL